jgi:hypothetical protein
VVAHQQYHYPKLCISYPIIKTSSYISKLLNPYTSLILMTNPILLKTLLLGCKSYQTKEPLMNQLMFSANTPLFLHELNTNLTPSKYFRKVFLKKVYTSFSRNKLMLNFIPIYYSTLIRFMEDVSGNSILLQFYPFVNQSVSTFFIIKYKLWLPRLTFYERRLGHKFFLEESIHILHLGFYLRDPSLILKWLKAIILRISF